MVPDDIVLGYSRGYADRLAHEFSDPTNWRDRRVPSSRSNMRGRRRLTSTMLPIPNAERTSGEPAVVRSSPSTYRRCLWVLLLRVLLYPSPPEQSRGNRRRRERLPPAVLISRSSTIEIVICR